jgi:hypothetical protein
VPLDTAGLLAAVATVQTATFTGPDTLTVHDGRAGSGIPAELHPLAFTQRRRHLFPHAVLLPATPVVVDRLPRR